MIDLLRVLVTGEAAQLNLLTGDISSLYLPWNIRWRLVVGVAIGRIRGRLWPQRTIEVIPTELDDTDSWEIPEDWFMTPDKRWEEKDSDPQAD